MASGWWSAGKSSPCSGCLLTGRDNFLPARVVCVWTGIIFSLLASKGLKWAFFAVLGEFCTGLALRWGLLGEFCTGVALRWGLPGEFCTGLALHAVCPESFVPGSVCCVASGWWSAGKSSPCSGCLLTGRDNFLPARVVCVWTGIIFSLLASKGLKWAFFAVLGEFCTGLALRWGLPGEFCTGGCLCGGASAPLGGFTCAG